MVKAIETAKSSKMEVHRAAKEFGVPRTTLKDRLSGRVQHGRKSGPNLYLSPDKEKELVTFLIDVCKMRQGKTKREVLDIVRSKVQMERKKEGAGVEKAGGLGLNKSTQT